MDDTVRHKASMQFSHELVTGVRDLILERGGAKPPRPDNPMAVVEPPDCTLLAHRDHDERRISRY